MQHTLVSYDTLALGYLAVTRKRDGALIGRCGLMDMVVESTEPVQGIRNGWFGREEAPAGVALTYECELGYTLDPAAWGQGFARSRRVAERGGARVEGQMHVVGLRWDRWVWPLQERSSS